MDRIVVSRLGAVLALVLLGLGLASVLALGQAERDTLPTDSLPAGSGSAEVAAIRDQLPEKDSSAAVVLLTSRDGGALDQAAAQQLLDRVDVPRVSQAAGQGGAPALVPSEDGEAAIAILQVDSTDATVLADAVTELRDQLRADAPDGIRAEVTGPAAVQADLAAVFDGADVRLLAVTASVVAILLVITYRSPVLWLVPLTVVGIADQTAAVAATRVLASLDVPWDESTTGILSVLVFGAGTDYALLLISRYRDELRSHEDRRDAMRLALRRTAEAVLSSATTVVLGLLALALSLVPSTRGLGIACAVGVVVAVVFVLVALPALLVLFGRWVFWPKVPHVGSASLADGHSLWRRVGDAVAGRTALFAAGTVVLLVALSGGLLATKLGLPQAEQFLDTPQAITASERLAEHFPAGSSDPAAVVTTDADGATRALEDTRGVESVRPGDSGGRWTELSVVLDADPDSAAARATIERMRDALADTPGTSYVGGTAAEALDTSDGANRDRLLIIPIILALVLGALVLLLRSLVAPVLLVLTVVGTYLAALGASWWVFDVVFGFSGLDDGVPLLAFLFLVALGVDYNIFLVTRAREEAAQHGTREGMLRGLAATGGVITSAGILLAAVFAVLGVLPLVVLAQLGVVIFVGVLLDTLVVRTVLVPALALLLGDRFWWPRRVGPGQTYEPQHLAEPGTEPALSGR